MNYSEFINLITPTYYFNLSIRARDNMNEIVRVASVSNFFLDNETESVLFDITLEGFKKKYETL